METDDLKVTITPQYAGKVWGIYDKRRNEDLLFANRAHQPANIGALKSWASGGSEWNWSPGIIGHSAFSETQTFLARVDTTRGPMLRVYEFDRYNGTVWQVDMIIANGSFIAHPKITNPNSKDLRGYWWTCVAVESRPSTRIFAPATHVAETSRDPMRRSDWPHFAMAIENASFAGFAGAAQTDNSYIGNHQIGDMFLRIPDTVYTPYIAHTQEDGYVLVHGHPLNGTKFFTWGQSGPGRFMQDFLAGGGRRQGDYTELQVGPAPTQMQNFAVPRNSVHQWTEWFKGFQGDTGVLYGTDYQAALDSIDTWMKSPSDGMPQERVQDWDAFFAAHSSDTPAEVLVQGQPWGYLEELLLGHPIAAGLTFSPPEAGSLGEAEAQPWVELVRDGTFSAATLELLPLSYQTTDGWLALLRASAASKGMTWLHALHIAVCLTERGDVEEPRRLFQQSLDMHPNPISARCLAVLSSTQEEAWPFFQDAWALAVTWPNQWALLWPRHDKAAYDRVTLNLVSEISFFLQQALWFDAMGAFLPSVPEAYRGVDAYVTMQVKFFMNSNDFAAARAVLGKNCFPTYAKARNDLMDMWNKCSEGLALQKKGGASLSILEKHQARSLPENRIPDNIGCQYASAYCTNYW